jgi:hypothetical protein
MDGTHAYYAPLKDEVGDWLFPANTPPCNSFGNFMHHTARAYEEAVRLVIDNATEPPDVELPSLEVSVIVGSTEVVVATGHPDLTADVALIVSVRDDVGTIIETKPSSTGLANRNVFFQGLNPDAFYSILVTAEDYADTTHFFATQPTLVGTDDVAVVVMPNAILPDVALVQIFYGDLTLLIGNPGWSETDQYPCSPGNSATVVMEDLTRGACYQYYHVFQDSNGTEIARGSIRYLAVS